MSEIIIIIRHPNKVVVCLITPSPSMNTANLLDFIKCESPKIPLPSGALSAQSYIVKSGLGV